MAEFKLSLTSAAGRTDGTFVPYSNTKEPAGRVWYRDGRVVAGKNPGHPGDPDFTVPALRDTDSLLIEIQDEQPDSVKNTSITVIFSHKKPREGKQAPFVSPFPGKDHRGVTFDEAVFGKTQRKGGLWWLGPLTVSFAREGRFNFEFAVGVVVDYEDGSVRHFGLDPEMDVENDPIPPERRNAR